MTGVVAVPAGRGERIELAAAAAAAVPAAGVGIGELNTPTTRKEAGQICPASLRGVSGV
jgi:hypothetical protein